MPTTTVKTVKGAFIDVGLGTTREAHNTIVFQFNPETITRTPSMVVPPPPNDGSGPRNAYHQPSEPSERISFSLRIDATDQLVQGSDSVAATRGILPTLSAFELLMIPQSSFSVDLHQQNGTAAPYRNPPLTLPTVLFYWGQYRILPVNITSLSITETEFDTKLNPVRAEVSVNLQVLTPTQVAQVDQVGRHYYAQTQRFKADMAVLNRQRAADIGVRTDDLQV